jgi:7-carboxy-7-deazaguanine synthase
VLVENVRDAMKLTVTDIMRLIQQLPYPSSNWVTLSGGNPALLDLDKLVDALHMAEFKVAVETQGSRWKDWLLKVDQLTVSPKPPSSGMKNDYLPTFMAAYFSKADDQSTLCLKVPVYDERDLDFAIGVHWAYPDFPFYISIVTEMGGLHGDFGAGRVDTADSLLARYNRVAQDVLRRGVPDVRVIPQLHYLIWGNKIGV